MLLGLILPPWGPWKYAPIQEAGQLLEDHTEFIMDRQAPIAV